MDTPAHFTLSVIVPVYNHWDRIPGLVSCLAEQTLGKDRFELLLVDNGSDTIPDNPDLPDFAKLLHCPAPGSYAARNKGINHAKGEFLAFTDADCRPATQWLEQLLTCYRQNNNPRTIIGGAIRILPAEPDNPTSYELYDMTLGIPQERYIRRGYATTANLFLPRNILHEVGNFDAKRFSGGDAEFCQRAGNYGIRTLYCENALIYHPARTNWAELSGKIRRIKGGQVKIGPYRRRLHYILRTFLPPVRAWRSILTSNRLKTWKQRLIVFTIQCRLWLVEITELIRLLLGKKPARS